MRPAWRFFVSVIGWRGAGAQNAFDACAGRRSAFAVIWPSEIVGWENPSARASAPLTVLLEMVATVAIASAAKPIAVIVIVFMGVFLVPT
jgi:hypothetical protein